MASPQLPAHLANSKLPRLADRAQAGGGSLPPHISIRGNEFTLIDAAGEQESVETKHLDGCIVDISDVKCKQYYGKKYSDGDNDPPLCWSANGTAPSREAQTPQAKTCHECQWNVRGSAISEISGASIKACRDELWTAVMLPTHPDMLFQLRITPGSFKTWDAYVAKFKNQPFDIKDVLTRVAFEKGKTGVLTFTPVNYIDEPQAKRRNEAVLGKATDVLVGRNDVPISGTAAVGTTGPQKAITQQDVSTTGPQTAEPAKRTRGRPAKPAQEATGEAPNGGTQMAPFRPEAAPAFGIGEAQAPPADLGAELDSFFKP